MKCPFLREDEARYCEVAPFRKMIAGTPRAGAAERCATPAWPLCPWAAGRRAAGGPRCPYLRSSAVQFCAAASVTRFIPHSDSLQSFCQSGGYRYCDLYLTRAEPGGEPEGGEGRPVLTRPGAAPAGRIAVPLHLAYGKNHMWIDLRDDGTWHAGLDAFFTQVAGQVAQVAFTSAPGIGRPSAMLRLGEVRAAVVFPNPVETTTLNASLRADPARLVRDPYGRGWLFAGRAAAADAAGGDGAATRGFLRGEEATRWMALEVERLTRFAQEHVGSRNDGGQVALPLAPYLRPEELVCLFQEFFR